MKREIIDHFGEELKSCPMCGAKPAKNAGEAWAGGVFVREDHRPPAWDGMWPACVIFVAECGGCGVRIQRGTLKAAVDAWNRRVKFAELTEEGREYFEEQEAIDRHVMSAEE